MQQPLPYKSHSDAAGVGLEPVVASVDDAVAEWRRRVVDENAVVVLAKRGCCMGHVIRRLLLSLGVNPAVYEVEDEVGFSGDLKMEIGPDGNRTGGGSEFPAVFVGGRLLGGLDRVVTAHIAGELVPALKSAGALWL